jgi:MGT family glycosyltransferase
MKILVYTSPARGQVYPLVPILDELHRRGHAISVFTLASELSLMKSRGFVAAAIAPGIESIDLADYLARSPQGQMKRLASVFAARAEHELADMRAAIETERPDAVLVDPIAWGDSAIADAWGGPWAQWVPHPLPLPAPELPPHGAGFRPATGPAGRLRDRLLSPLIWGLVNRVFLPRLNAVRHRAGVEPYSDATDMYTVAPLLLYMTAEPFEYHRSSWPSCVEMVGPCCWDPPAETPAWLAKTKKELVLVSTSSEFQDDGRLIATALQVLADEDVEVIATAPAAKLDGFVVPANARIEPFMPHTQVLERAICAVTHGGAGITQKALAAGVPVCAVPFGRDQLEVARRVEVAEAGTRLPAQRLTPERLLRKIRGAMTKQPGAQRVADGFAAAGGPAAAAARFDELAVGHAAGTLARHTKRRYKRSLSDR